MAKKKIYAVRKGKETGLFTSWDDCKASVDGYPGAEYKSFTDIESARHYLYGRAGLEDAAQKNISESDHVIAYVDGSFDQNIGRYAFGCILILPDGRTLRRSGSGNQPESLAIRNVAGEMLGAMYASLWTIKNGFKSLDICYDYAGIEKWAMGDWKTNNELTKKYAAFMSDCRQRIRIKFKKIAAHTGDYYNEQADQLAKSALTGQIGIPKVEKEV